MKLRIIFASILVMFSLPAKAEQISSTTEFKVPHNRSMTPIPQFSPLIHVKGNTYFVWVDLANRPQVTQKVDGTVSTAPVDANVDYAAAPDSHHGFSIGVDKYGYIHVAGDMHNYPNNVPRTPPLPARYIGQNSMYWVSNKPYDVTAGFRFAGAKVDPSGGLPAGSFTYPKFHHAPNGDLYFTSLSRAYLNPFDGHTSGSFGLALLKFDPDNKKWMSLGGYPALDVPNNGPKFKVFFWEMGGINGWFQGYIPGVQFDAQGRLHMAWASNLDSTTGLLRLFYAMSPDGGQTWKRADGSAIGGVPLRGIESEPNHADIIFDGTTAIPVSDYTRVTADKNGTPMVFNGPYWRRWDGSKWNQDIHNPQQAIGVNAYLGSDNKTTFVSDYWWMARSRSFTEASSTYLIQDYVPGGGMLRTISDLSLTASNSIYAAETSSTSEISIVKISFVEKPLPAGWSEKNIGTTQMGGSAEYDQGNLTIRGAGNGLAGTSDTLFYANRILVGDGSILARVSQRYSEGSTATVGVQMRETLAPDSKFVSIGLANDLKGRMTYRLAAGQASVDKPDWKTPAPYWVKLERKGNSFTSYLSPDGQTWTVYQSPITIEMPQTIFVGAFSHGNQLDRIHPGLLENLRVDVATPVCGQAKPTMSMSPTTQKIIPGQSATYTMTIRDNNPVGCSYSVYRFSGGGPYPLSGKLSSTSIILNPGQSGTIQLNLTSPASTPLQDYAVSVSGYYLSQPAIIFTATANLSVVAPVACNTAPPTMNFLNPNLSVIAGESVTFTLQLKDNNALSCPASIFRFSGSVPYPMIGRFDHTSMILGAGQTSTVQLTVNSNGASPKVYPISASAVYLGAPQPVWIAPGNLEIK